MSELGRMIWENVTAIGDEEKEECIHCGKEWYRTHHNDGVCRRCQKQGLPGRTELAEKKLLFKWVVFIGIAVLCLLVFLVILG